MWANSGALICVSLDGTCQDSHAGSCQGNATQAGHAGLGWQAWERRMRSSTYDIILQPYEVPKSDIRKPPAYVSMASNMPGAPALNVVHHIAHARCEGQPVLCSSTAVLQHCSAYSRACSTYSSDRFIRMFCACTPMHTCIVLLHGPCPVCMATRHPCHAHAFIPVFMYCCSRLQP